MMDLPQIKNDIDKVIEFNKILNAIDPTKILPTTRDAIEEERAGTRKRIYRFYSRARNYAMNGMKYMLLMVANHLMKILSIEQGDWKLRRTS